MAAATINVIETLLAAPGELPRIVDHQIVVTNGTKAVSVIVTTRRKGQDDEVTYLPPLSEEAVELLISALSAKVVNLHRGVHDNDEGAI